ncbi:MAG: hypothetical protein SGI71_03870 [Verrucomicrobiota bacterium]|nr:hypothetical protein [Verrucomicrobiota bacterium]
MNTTLLSSIEDFITSESVPRDGDLFAGAGLIVTDDPKRNRHEDDVFVQSPLARQISWVIFQMQSVFSDEIDYLNKRTFYPAMGRAANAALKSGLSEKDVLRAIIAEAKDFFLSNRP